MILAVDSDAGLARRLVVQIRGLDLRLRHRDGPLSLRVSRRSAGRRRSAKNGRLFRVFGDTTEAHNGSNFWRRSKQVAANRGTAFHYFKFPTHDSNVD